MTFVNMSTIRWWDSTRRWCAWCKCFEAATPKLTVTISSVSRTQTTLPIQWVALTLHLHLHPSWRRMGLCWSFGGSLSSLCSCSDPIVWGCLKEKRLTSQIELIIDFLISETMMMIIQQFLRSIRKICPKYNKIYWKPVFWVFLFCKFVI